MSASCARARCTVILEPRRRFAFFRVDPTPKSALRVGIAASAEVAALQGRASAAAHLSPDEIAALRESLDIVEDELRKHSATLRKRSELRRLGAVSASMRLSRVMTPPAVATVAEAEGSSDDER